MKETEERVSWKRDWPLGRDLSRLIVYVWGFAEVTLMQHIEREPANNAS